MILFAGVNLIKYLEATSPGSIPAESVLRYAEHLKQRYRRLSTQTDGWTPSKIKNKMYTSLALIKVEHDTRDSSPSMEHDYIHGKIDNIVAEKEGIELNEVFFPLINHKTKLRKLAYNFNGWGTRGR